MNLAHGIFRFVWNQSWIGLRYKKAVYKRLCNSGEVPDAPFSTDFFGLQYKGNLNNSVEFALFYLGAFEKPLLFFLQDTMLNLKKSHGESPQNFIDIGAKVHEGRHQHHAFADERGPAHNRPRHSAETGGAPVGRGPAVEFRWHLVPPCAVAIAAGDRFHIVQEKGQQHRLFRPLVHVPRPVRLLFRHAQRAAVQRVQGGFNRVADLALCF